MEELDPLTVAVVEGRREQAIAETQRWLDRGADPRVIIERYPG
jgi:hypothetical protein